MKYETRITRTPRTRTPSRFLTLQPTLIISILAFTTSISAQSSNNPSESATPTTFQTSVSASISSQQPTPPSSTSASNTPPSNTSPTSNPSNPTNSNDNGNINGNTNGNRSAFNYYFLIIAAVIVLLGIALLYYRSQRRQKAFLQRTNSQRALARDVEGFRNRLNFGSGNGAFGIGGGGAYRSGANGSAGSNGVTVVEEGLDERGEAPPPYVEGAKPPSIRETRSDGLPEGEEGIEMSDLGMTRPNGGGGGSGGGGTAENAPPSYDEQLGDGRMSPAPTHALGLPTIRVSSPVNLDTNASTAQGVQESRESLGDLDLRRPLPVITAPERSVGTGTGAL